MSNYFAYENLEEEEERSRESDSRSGDISGLFASETSTEQPLPVDNVREYSEVPSNSLESVTEVFSKLFKKLAEAASDVNGIPYSVMFSYWQRRMSTTLQRYNAKVFNLAQLKISKAGGSRLNERV